jgi:adenosine kinase
MWKRWGSSAASPRFHFQNTIRVAQWLLGKKASCTYFGCIGNDKFGKVLQSKAGDDGVNAVYQLHPQEATGTCAVVCTEGGTKRSLVANLAAANLFTIDHVNAHQNWKNVQMANVYYIAGFFFNGVASINYESGSTRM